MGLSTLWCPRLVSLICEMILVPQLSGRNMCPQASRLGDKEGVQETSLGPAMLPMAFSCLSR